MPADQVFRQKGSVKRQRQKAASKSNVKKQRQLVSEMAPTGGWHGDIRLQIIEMQRSFITDSIQLERNYLIASVRFSAARSSATCAGPPSLGSAAMSLRSCKRTLRVAVAVYCAHHRFDCTRGFCALAGVLHDIIRVSDRM